MRTAPLLLLSFGLITSGCSSTRILDNYYKYNATKRENLPSEYVTFLKTTRFTNGELDQLPTFAVIFYGDVPAMLGKLGYGTADTKSLKLGTSDPTVLTIVSTKSGFRFMIEQGMPGGGAVSTQAAELIALGAKYVVHIGLCAALGDRVLPDQLIIGRSAYMDGAAVVLSNAPEDSPTQLTFPNEALASNLKTCLRSSNVDAIEGTGFTCPVYYFEPSGLLKALLEPSQNHMKADFIEMEQAALFAVAARMGAAAASVVVPGDRFTMKDHKLLHEYLHNNQPVLLAAAVKAAIDVGEQLSRK